MDSEGTSLLKQIGDWLVCLIDVTVVLGKPPRDTSQRPQLDEMDAANLLINP